MRELENRVNNVTAQVASADEAVAPVRQNLAAQGHTLSADQSSTLTRMHQMLDRANRDIAGGDAAAAREDLDAASALAAKILRQYGR
jgi:hypothetical protein